MTPFLRLSLRPAARLLAFSFLAALPLGCAVHTRQAAPPTTPPFSLESPAVLHVDGTPAPMSELVGRAKHSRYILIGESHDNTGDHAMQAHLLKALAEAGQRPLLGLEMVDTGQQKVLDSFNKGALSVDGLEAALNWPETWGYDFSLYRPVFAVAQRYRMPVVALNAPRTVVRAVSAKGMEGVAREDRRSLPARLIPPLPAQEARLRAIFDEHTTMRQKAMAAAVAATAEDKTASAEGKTASSEGKTPPQAPAPATTAAAPTTEAATAPERAPGQPAPSGTAATPPPGGTDAGAAPGAPPGFTAFLRVQSLWDTTMAEQAIRAHKQTGRPVVILAGSGHVEHGFGIASRLKKLDPRGATLLIMPVRGETVFALHKGQPAGENTLPPLADFLVYTRPHSTSPQGLSLFSHAGQVWVEAVTPGSKADAAGIAPGDVIVRVQGEALHSLMNMHRLGMAAKKTGAPLRFVILREGEKRRVRL